MGEQDVYNPSVPTDELTCFYCVVQNPQAHRWYQLNSERQKAKLYESEKKFVEKKRG